MKSYCSRQRKEDHEIEIAKQTNKLKTNTSLVNRSKKSYFDDTSIVDYSSCSIMNRCSRLETQPNGWFFTPRPAVFQTIRQKNNVHHTKNQSSCTLNPEEINQENKTLFLNTIQSSGHAFKQIKTADIDDTVSSKQINEEFSFTFSYE